MIGRKTLEESYTECTKLIDGFTKELKRLPEGRLLLFRKDRFGRPVYYCQKDGKRTRLREDDKNDCHSINALRRKRCIQESLRILRRNKRLLKHSLQGYESFDPDCIKSRLSESYKTGNWSFNGIPELKKTSFNSHAFIPTTEDARRYYETGEVDKLLTTDSRGRLYWASAREFLQSAYPDYNFPDTLADKISVTDDRVFIVRPFPQFLNHDTGRGFNVRSKSEIIIATVLREHALTFFYEWPMIIGDNLFFPDFTIAIDNSVIRLYEHFGRIDDPGYEKRNSGKLFAMMRSGIIPGNQLLITCEDKDHPLKMEAIENVISMLR